jgi:superfamily I DNA and/or RNA helicase
MNLYDIDSEKIIIVVFNKKDNGWRDVTEEVTSVCGGNYYSKYGDQNYKITYKNGKTYPYNYDKVKIYNFTKEINVKGKIVVVKGTKYLNVIRICQFDNVYKIFLTESKSIFANNFELVEENSDNETNVFKYYKELAQYANQLIDGEDSVESFIWSQYQGLTSIDSETVLSSYINKTNNKFNRTNTIIFPFQFNESQKSAIHIALTNQVSIIEGPPGCGKTQTILNLLSNLIVQGKTAAVVSNNNTAIKNIQDKLSEEKLDFICALLGNKDNKTLFFENLSNEPLNKFMEEYKERYSSNQNYSFEYYYSTLSELHRAENKKANLINKESLVKKEYEHFKIKNNATSIKKYIVKDLRSSEYLNIRAELERKKKFNFISRLIFRFKYRVKINSIYNINDFSLFLENMFYIKSLSELNNEIEKLESYLFNKSFENIKESNRFLSNFLYKKYFIKRFKDFNLESYKFNFNDFSKRFPVILSTSHSLLTSIDSTFKFDYLIVDEASQSELISSLLAMSCAKNIVVVGDSKQLDQINNENIVEYSKNIAVKYKIPQEYTYNDNSLLGSFRKVFPSAPITLLQEHYRCHPTIVNFINHKYYDDKLIIMTTHTEETPVTLIELVKGNHARKNPNGSGQYNQREIDEVVEYLKNIECDDIGIITPFRIQAEKFRELLKEKSNIEVDTVHKFQGRQKDTIIISTVVNNIEKNDENDRLINFIDNPKLFNVALSRAKNRVIFVGTNGLFNSKNNNFIDFIKYSKYNSNYSDLIKGKVTSVFDYLYSSYNNVLNNLKKNQTFDDLIITERLISNLLLKILKEYKDLKFAMHVSLNNIINDFDRFDDKEKKYLQNNWTHVDFLIYNSLTKENILAIEVDGVKYHEQSEIQSLRDKIKNEAFEKIGIKLLRIKTNESKEEQRIKNQLNDFFS